MAKSDIEDAFRLLCINPRDYNLLMCSFNRDFYYDRSIAMGASSAFNLFERFSSAIQWVMSNKFSIHGISHLLDDFFFVGRENTNHCMSALSRFTDLCTDIGIPIKHEKTQLPTTIITIYGIEIDSDAMIARLPQYK